MKKYKILFRILADLAMIAAIAWAPWWLILIGLIAFAWLFAPYYEIIVWGLAYDALYGMRGWIGTVTVFVIFAVVEVVNRRVRH